MHAHETFYDVMRRHGVTRRSFLKFCSLTAAGLTSVRLSALLERVDVNAGALRAALSRLARDG